MTTPVIKHPDGLVQYPGLPTNTGLVSDALENTQQNLLSTSVSLKKVMASSDHFTEQPGLAAALASGHPSDDQLAAIGQFVSGLALQKRVELARASGHMLDLDDYEKTNLDSMGVDYSKVDAAAVRAANAKAAQKKAEQKKQAKQQSVASTSGGGGGGILGHVGGFFKTVGGGIATGAEATYHGVKKGAGETLGALNRAADASLTVSRMGGTFGQLGIGSAEQALGIPGAQQDIEAGAGGVTQNVATGKAQGYNDSFWSQLAYYSHGANIYKDTSPLAKEYGDDNVDVAKQYLTAHDNGTLGDFQNMKDLSADQIVGRRRALNDPRFQELVGKLDGYHISPGRQLASGFGLKEGTTGFHLASGAGDALTSWFADPTLVAGKITKAARISRITMGSLVDENDIRKIMGNNGRIRRGWQSYLDDAKITREGTAQEQQAALARIRVRTPDLVPILTEINGGGRRVAAGTKVLAGAPIENLDDLTEYLVKENALIRTSVGQASRQTALMPGSLSKFGARQVRAALASGIAKRSGKVLEKRGIDINSQPWRYIATPGDAESAVDLDPAAVEAARRTGQESLNYLQHGDATGSALIDAIPGLGTLAAGGLTKASRARYVYTAKKLMNLAPKAGLMDLHDPKAAENVRRLAATYLPQTVARLVEAQFTAGDIEAKRRIAKGLQEQIIHASGLDQSASGKLMAEQLRKDLATAERQRYSVIPELDTISDEAGTRHIALHDGQLSTGVYFPSFREMHQIAAKVSVYDHVFRKTLENPTMDAALRLMRTGWLTTVSGGMRNALEEGGSYALMRGGKAWLRGFGAANAQKLAAKAIRTQIPEDLRPGIVDEKSLTHAVVISKLRQLKGTVYGKILSDAEHNSAADDIFLSGMGNKFLHKVDGISNAALGGEQLPDGADIAGEIAGAGFKSQEYGWKLAGWKGIEAHGEAGATAWAHNLNQRFTDTRMGQKLLDIIENDTADTRRQALFHMLASDDMKQWRDYAEIMRPWKDKSLSLDARRDAVHEVIDKQVQDVRALLSNPDGDLNKKMISYLREHNEAPSTSWIQRNIKAVDRPAQVIARDYMPAMPDGSNVVQQFMEGFSAKLMKAYNLFNARPAAYLARHPIFVGNVALAARHLKGLAETYMREGISKEAAEDMARNARLERAFDMTVRQVDNPDVASQLSVVSRNFFNFYRAVEDQARRWGRAVREDPAALRRAQLIYEGSQHAGFVERDADGNAVFVYPGSGAVLKAIGDAGTALHIPGFASIPSMPNLSSKVLFLNASFDNPIQITVSPLIGTPLHYVSQLMPEHKLASSKLETLLLGQQGTGKSAWEDFMPTAVQRFGKLLNTDDRNSQIASATINAIKNLTAAGLAPPPNASAKEVDAFLARVKVAARNQLFLRAVGAFFLPATPSQPENTVDGKTDADAFDRAQGIRTLAEEAKKMINDYGYDKALAVWTKLHPDKLMYFEPATQSTEKTVLGATDDTEKWMESNYHVLKKYGVAAYFIPSGKGKFSQEAYNSQLELGLRTRKSISEFYTDVRTQNAETLYYNSKDNYDTALAQAHAVGDDGRVKALKSAWSEWSGTFLAANPLFAQKQASWGIDSVQRKGTLAELKKLVQDPSRGRIFGGNEPVVKNLLGSYDSYTSWMAANAQKRDKETTADKQAVTAGYEGHIAQLAQQYPDLKPLINGIFRVSGTPQID